MAVSGALALAEGPREKPDFDAEREGSIEFGKVTDIFKDIDLGFGGDDGEGEGTHLDRFEVPELEVYEELAAKRAVTLSINRSNGYGLVPAVELNVYVNRVLQRIVAASPVPSLDAIAYVRSERGFGAASSADGSIYVNIDTLQDVQSEDELAAILAHELAHILYRHHGSDWFANYQKIGAQALSMKDEIKGFIEKDASADPSDETFAASVSSMVSEQIVAPNLWNRAQEREADGLGIDLMVAAGYLTGAARQAMERLAFYEEEKHKLAQKELEEREKAIKAEMDQAVQSGDVTNIVVGFAKGAGKAMNMAFGATVDALGGGDHDPAEVRLEWIDAYINREHLLAPRPPATALPWRKPGDPTAAVLANYLAARKAEGALAQGKLDEAEALIRTAVSGPTKADPYPRVVFAELRQQQGNFAKAYKNLQIASEGPEPAFAVYRRMIAKMLAGGKNQEAVRLVGEATERLGEPPHLFPYHIAILASTEQKADALALAAKCRLEYPELARDCKRAVGGLEAAVADGGDDEDDMLTNAVTTKAFGGGSLEDSLTDMKTGFAPQ